MSGRVEVWVSDGLPSAALGEFLATAKPQSWRRLPLVGGVTVWDESPPENLRVAVACPNRLGAYETLSPHRQWEQVWWWSDPLDARGSLYRCAPRVHRVAAPAPLPADRSLREAADRSQRAADYLARRIRQIRGVRIPSVPFGRRFPVLLPVAPVPLLEAAAEELVIPRPVDGWPGLVVCQAGWWQPTERLDAVVEIVARAAAGEKSPPLAGSERIWPSRGR